MRSPFSFPSRSDILNHTDHVVFRHSKKAKRSAKKMPRSIFTSHTILKDLLLLFSTTFMFYLLYQLHSLNYPPTHPTLTLQPTPPPPLSLSHLHFSIASSSSSLPFRVPYINLWFSPNSTNALLFMDRPTSDPTPSSLPPIVISSDSSNFAYTHPKGKPSATRIARIVNETLTTLNDRSSAFRWFVFGDDDTVFFTENLVKVLSKYDDRLWYYVGCGSEGYEQNVKHSFDMAFGGAGFAISAPLARVLARVLDSCLVRYPHLYGSDDRIFACLVELGVSLTREPGFHQVDVRGNLFGLLTAHPLSPLLSLHHLDAAEPIFPAMSKIEALELLFRAVQADSVRILQQSVCYDRSNSLTVAIAWGYAIQVYEGDQLLPELLSVQRSFRPWRRSQNPYRSHYMFSTREFSMDSCKRPAVFFLKSVTSNQNVVWTDYTKNDFGNCVRNETVQKLKNIRVFSKKLEIDSDQLKAPRRQCCYIRSRMDEAVAIHIRQCGIDELISMPS